MVNQYNAGTTSDDLTTKYAYDALDDVTQVTDPKGGATSYTYDAFGDVLSEVSPDRGTTTYTYDSAGNRISKTDANGVQVAYTYDALDRLKTASYPDSSLNISYFYDGDGEANPSSLNGIGHLTRMEDGTAVTRYAYDKRGNELTESRTVNINGVTYTTAYTYDSADNVATITYPSGRVVTYNRDALGRVSSVTTTVAGSTTTVVGNLTYKPFGPVTGLSYGNGLLLQQGFDTAYRMTGQQLGTSPSAPASVDSVNYSYDLADNVTGLATSRSDAPGFSYAYDELQRVSRQTLPGALQNDFAYDANGNRTGVTETDLQHGVTLYSRTTNYDPNANRVTCPANAPGCLDAIGNTVTDPVNPARQFTYDQRNQMASFKLNGTTKESYLYNGVGQAVIAGTTMANYLQGGQLSSLYAPGPSGALTYVDYVWLGDQPVAEFVRLGAGYPDGGNYALYLLSNPVQAPLVGTDAHQAVAWEWVGSLSPFDNQQPIVPTAAQSSYGDTILANVMALRYPGQIYDQPSGLHYNWHRYYDPTTGRYLQADPIGLAGGLNPYAYVLNSPLTAIDPLGLDTYRYGGNEYSDRYNPSRAECQRAVTIGGTIIGWTPCNPDNASKCPATNPSDPSPFSPVPPQLAQQPFSSPAPSPREREETTPFDQKTAPGIYNPPLVPPNAIQPLCISQSGCGPCGASQLVCVVRKSNFPYIGIGHGRCSDWQCRTRTATVGVR